MTDGMTPASPAAPPAAPPPAAPPAAPPASPAAAPPAVSNDPAWYRSFGLDDTANAFIAGKGFTNIADLVKSGMEADRLVRDRNIMAAPDPDPTKRRDWDGFERLGWTQKREDYRIESPKAPEGFDYNTDAEKQFLDAAHAARIPTWQAQELLNAMADYGFKAQDKAISEAALENKRLNEALDKEWGKDAPVMRERARAAAAYMGVGADDAAQLEKAIGAPGLVKFFAKLGAMLGEDTIKGGAAGGAARTLGVDSARAEMDRLKADRVFAKSLIDPSDPAHARNLARWNELIALANRKD